MDFKDIVRDTAFIFFVTYWTGFALGYLGYLHQPNLIVLLSYAAGFIGFCIIAHWQKKDRLPHLLSVALLLWFFKAAETLLAHDIKSWFISGALTFCAALAAFGLSGVIRRS